MLIWLRFEVIRLARKQSLPVLLVFFLVFPLAHSVVLAQQATSTFQPTAAQLEAVSGEYTNPSDPDTPNSFYAKDGKLVVENERSHPTALEAISAQEFAAPKHKTPFVFLRDASGH